MPHTTYTIRLVGLVTQVVLLKDIDIVPSRRLVQGMRWFNLNEGRKRLTECPGEKWDGRNCQRTPENV